MGDVELVVAFADRVVLAGIDDVLVFDCEPRSARWKNCACDAGTLVAFSPTVPPVTS
jgi:hypothetical protein